MNAMIIIIVGTITEGEVIFVDFPAIGDPLDVDTTRDLLVNCLREKILIFPQDNIFHKKEMKNFLITWIIYSQKMMKKQQEHYL
jgi:hypothetical protein